MSYEAELDDRDWDNEDDESIYDIIAILDTRCADCGVEFDDAGELMEHSAVHEDAE